MQAAEIIKYLTRGRSALTGRMLLYDGLNMTCTIQTLKKDPDCSACGNILTTSLPGYPRQSYL
jgi:hypothetical protein